MRGSRHGICPACNVAHWYTNQNPERRRKSFVKGQRVQVTQEAADRGLHPAGTLATVSATNKCCSVGIIVDGNKTAQYYGVDCWEAVKEKEVGGDYVSVPTARTIVRDRQYKEDE